MAESFLISRELTDHFVKWSSGILNSEKLDALVSLFEKELGRYFYTRTEESNLIRIINSVIDKAAFLQDCIKYPHHVEIICSIACCSNYLSDILVRNPELIYQLFSESYLASPILEKSLLKEISNGFAIFKKPESKLRFLKNLKRKYLLKIGVNDILHNYELGEVVKTNSMLAYSIIDNLFELCYNIVKEKYGIKKISRKYCLLALGKLGGYELNYSSDIDLMIIYDQDSMVGTDNKLHFADLLNETVNLFVKQSTEFSDLGNLYRVDFRLRPDGDVSPLSRSFIDTINYYEARGEQWEKQMLIKINFAGGDKKLYDQFLAFVHSYVYKSTYFASPLATIEKMKNNIEKQYADDLNVKTSRGAIRDIEFSVQGLQLINGRKYPDLRSGNTLLSLKILLEHSLLTTEEYQTFTSAYLFFRKIEHFLQLMNNTQTHSIPHDKIKQQQLAEFMGYKSSQKFISSYNNVRNKVRLIFDNIISPDKSTEEGKDLFLDITFNDKIRAKKNIEYLEFGTGLTSLKSFDSLTSSRFASIKIELINLLSQSNNPDIILENFTKVIRGYKFPSIFYLELGNKSLLKSFVSILERCEFSVALLQQHPPLVENFISKKIFHKDYSEIFEHSNYNELLFIISSQYALGLIDPNKLSDTLTLYIKRKIESVFNSMEIRSDVFIAGLGSFALHDINLKSDIDLIVVAEDVMLEVNLQEKFQEFISQLKQKLYPVEIDFRLRPEGKSSQLVWDIHNYNKYLKDRAGIWEYQSLIKSNFICGSEKLFRRFTTIVYKNIKQMPIGTIKAAIIDMHSKSTRQKFAGLGYSIDLKNSAGSFMTIDYLLTYKLLLEETKSKMLIGGKKKSQVIKSRFQNNQQLYNDYMFLKETLLAMQISLNWSKAKLPAENSQLEMICKFLNIESASTLEKNLNSILARVQKLYTDIIK